MTLRAQALYFTCCPGCSIYILTNRDIAKNTRCRLCGQAHDTLPSTNPLIDRLLEQVEHAIGRTKIATRLVHVLLCQHEKEETLHTAERVCEQAGLKRLSDNAPVVFWLLEEGANRGLMRFSQPYSAWRLDDEGNSSTYQDAMSTEIDRVLRVLRNEQPNIRTMSASLDPSNRAHRAFLSSLNELVDASDDLSSHADFEFDAERKLAKGDVEGARAIAERMLAVDGPSARALAILGRIAARTEKWNEAIGFLERAVAIDPLDRYILEILVACYQRTQQKDKAAEAWARLARVGGPKYTV